MQILILLTFIGVLPVRIAEPGIIKYICLILKSRQNSQRDQQEKRHMVNKFIFLVEYFIFIRVLNSKDHRLIMPLCTPP